MRFKLPFIVLASIAFQHAYCQNGSSDNKAELEAKSSRDKGAALYFDKKYDEAIPWLIKAIDLNPTDAHALKMRSSCYSALDQFDKALTDQSRIMAMEPDNIDHYFDRGALYMFLEKYDLAVADFNTLLKELPDDMLTIAFRAECYAGLRRYEEAIADFSRVLQEHPQDNFFLQRAQAYAAIGNTDKACEDLRAVEKLEETPEVTAILKQCK